LVDAPVAGVPALYEFLRDYPVAIVADTDVRFDLQGGALQFPKGWLVLFGGTSRKSTVGVPADHRRPISEFDLCTAGISMLRTRSESAER
jgi:hypothetical protein